MNKITDKELAKAAYRAADASGVAVASRLQILEYLTQRNQPVALAPICQHFNILSEEGINALSARLHRMAKNGYVLLDRKQRYGLPEKMDIVIGRVSGHAKGFGFVIPDSDSKKNASQKPSQNRSWTDGDLYLHHSQMRKVLHGDLVLAKTKSIDKRGRKEGVIIEVLIEQDREIVGYFHLEGGIGFVEPVDTRFARDISIPRNYFNSAKNADIVVIRILQHPIEHRHTVGEIIEVVGRDLAPGMETDIALRKHEIPHSWPQEVKQQLDIMGKLLTKAEPALNRKDIRDLALVTIDGSDAKDFDDAVYCERLTGAGQPGGWRLLVAIADVSHYVQADSALDNEAYVRGNSVYFPNRVIPMLPESLSNGICSLKPEQDRYCLVCDMQLTNTGEVAHYQFYSGLMHSQARLTYALVNMLVVDKDPKQRQAWALLTPHLDNLYEMSLCLRKNRIMHGAIEFEFPQPCIKFDHKKRIRHISIQHRNDAHRLIEECMLAANVCAAEFLQTHRASHAIYRNHAAPEMDTLANLRTFLNGLGLTLSGGDKPKATDYSRLVAAIAHRDDIAGVVQSALLRSLNQAVYSTDQIGHFALAFPIYCHFTSPIRRYCDLVVHRQISQILSQRGDDDADNDNQEIGVAGVSMLQIAEHCSFTERRADDASRDAMDWLKTEFMQNKVGEVFEGVISGVKEFGIFVLLNELFVDGLVHVTNLGDDYYHFDPIRYQLLGERTAQRFRLGDRLTVRVVRVDLSEAKIDFDLVSASPSAEQSGKGKHKNRATKSRK